MAFSTNERPGIAERVGDARSFQGDLFDRSCTSTVRSSDAESGSWMLTISRPLSWTGNEAGRNAREAEARQADQADIDQAARSH